MEFVQGLLNNIFRRFPIAILVLLDAVKISDNLIFIFFKNSQMKTNLMISPLSLDYVLNLFFLGTTKKTFYEVKRGLNYPKDFTAKIIEANLLKWSTLVKNINGVEVG